MLTRLRKFLIPGVTWQHPVVSAVLHGLDPVDWMVRAARGLSHLPPLTIRVRSNGLRGQFGGTKFVRLGKSFADELVAQADLKPDCKVLEIGCGCGRNAFGLSDRLNDGSFFGVDIDMPSIRSARQNVFLRKKRYTFEYLDVDNPEYNPKGRYKASEYRFEYPDNTFDVIFLVSVVTHLLPRDLENYISEISRMLKPGGRLVFTTFLMDIATHFGPVQFEYGEGPWRSAHKEIPEICVGYYLDYLDRTMTDSGLTRLVEPLASTVGQRTLTGRTTDFDQDIVIATKPVDA